MSAAEPLHLPTIPAPSRDSQGSAIRGATSDGALDLSTPRPRTHVTKREVVWALVLCLVLAVGIVGTLLLQTSMQAQARVTQQERARMAALQQQAQDLRRELAHDADPSVLAARARALHMRPQNRPAFIRAGGRR